MDEALELHEVLTARVENEHRSYAEAERKSKPESTEGRPWGQPLKKLLGAPLNLG